MYLFSAYALHYVFYVCACVYDLYLMCVCACLFFFFLFFFLCNKLEFRWLYLAHTSSVKPKLIICTTSTCISVYLIQWTIYTVKSDCYLDLYHILSIISTYKIGKKTLFLGGRMVLNTDSISGRVFRTPTS